MAVVNAPATSRQRKLIASTRITPFERALIQATAFDEGTDISTLIRRVVMPYCRKRLAQTDNAPSTDD